MGSVLHFDPSVPQAPFRLGGRFRSANPDPIALGGMEGRRGIFLELIINIASHGASPWVSNRVDIAVGNRWGAKNIVSLEVKQRVSLGLYRLIFCEFRKGVAGVD